MNLKVKTEEGRGEKQYWMMKYTWNKKCKNWYDHINLKALAKIVHEMKVSTIQT